MSAHRKPLLVLALSVAALMMMAASAFAQTGGPSPGGGTSLRQYVEEGTVSLGLKDYVSRGLSIDAAVRSWFSGFAASRSLVTVAARPGAGHTLAAIAPRRFWGR